MITTDQANKAIDLLLIEFGLQRTDKAVSQIKYLLKSIDTAQFVANEQNMRDQWDRQQKEKWEIIEREV